MSFFILCTGDSDKESVESIQNSIKAHSDSFTCESSLEKAGLKDHVKSKYVILYLKKKSLRDKMLVNKFQLTVRHKIKYAVLCEADVKKGALFVSKEFPVIDISAILKDPKSPPKARKALLDISVLAYRKFSPLSLFCIKRVLHSFGLLDLPDTNLFAPQNLPRIETEKLSSSVEKTYGLLNSAPKKTKVNVVGFNSGSSENKFAAQFYKDLGGKIVISSHAFDKYDMSTRSGVICLENLSKQLSKAIPEYNKGFSLPTFTIEQCFTELIEKPSKRVGLRKQIVFIVIRNIDQGHDSEIKSIMHLFQSISLPKWIRVLITGRKDTISLLALPSISVNHIEEPDLSEATLSESYSLGTKLDEFSELLKEKAQQTALLAFLSVVHYPLPLTLLEKIFEVDEASIETCFQKASCIEIITIKDVKSCKCRNIFNRQEPLTRLDKGIGNKILETLKSTISSEKSGYEVEFCFKEVLNISFEISNVETYTSYLKDVSWVIDRINFGVVSFLYNLKELFTKVKQKESFKSSLPVATFWLNFLEQSKHAVYRDRKEIQAQLFARCKEDMKKLDILTSVSELKLNDEEKSKFLPIRSTLARTINIIGDITADSYLEREPYVQICCSKANRNSLWAGTSSGDILRYSSNALKFEKISTSRLHKTKVVDISVSDKEVLSISENGQGFLNDSSSGKVIHVFDGFEQPLQSCSIHKEMYILSTAVTLKAFDKKFKPILEVSLERASCLADCYRDGFLAIIGYPNGSLATLTTKGKLEPFTQKGHLRGIVNVATHVDQPDIVVSTGFDRKVCVWNLSNKHPSLTSSFSALAGTATELILTKDSIIVGSLDVQAISILDLKGKLISKYSLSCSGVESVCCLPDNVLFVFGTDYRTRLIDSGRASVSLENSHNDWIKCLAVSTCSNEVATGSLDGRIVVWNSCTGDKLRVLTCEAYAGNLFVFSKDGKYLLSRVGAWDSDTGLRVKYYNIAKTNRHPLEKNFEQTALFGYMNLLELDNGVCFTTDSSESLLRAKLPTSEFRKDNIIVCCSGKRVHFLKQS